MNMLCIFISMLVAARAHYHEQIGIPLAVRVKAYEDKIFANPEMQSRVIDGDIAPDNKYPYMASLIMPLQGDNVTLCGSSIVTTTRLVTAAHCLEGASVVNARFGSSFVFHGGIEMSSKDFSKHPDLYYESVTKLPVNDVGIVRLPSELQFSDTIQPISLPRPGEERVVGEIAMTAGWGITSDAQRNETEADTNLRLREAAVEVADETMCEGKFAAPFLHGKVVCTEGPGNRGLCQGDSGGPLVVERNGRKIMIGVFSFVNSVCEAPQPTVYTKVETYTSFIMN